MHYDWIFLGMGGGNANMLLALHHSGALAGKRIAVFEPNPDVLCSKTYCFWASPDDPKLAHVQDVIQHRWSSVAFESAPQDLEGLVYHYIPGESLHNEVKNCLRQVGATLYQEAAYWSGTDGDFQVRSGTHTLQAKRIYDGRTPKAPSDAHPFLWQSFVGWRVRTDHPHWNPEMFRMMDFRLPDTGHTQFMYVLPFAPNEALVEVTRFDRESISNSEAKDLLVDYLAHVGPYTVTSTEAGRIPMTTADLSDPYHQGVVQTGARANAIKPSTGYAFWNMLCAAHGHAQNPAQTPAPMRRGRHGWYDKVLLHLTHTSAATGTRVLRSLLQHTRPNNLLTFLNENTSVGQELRIFSRLPWRPFLKAALQLESANPTVHAAFLCVIALVLNSFASAFPTITFTVSAVLLAAGLLAVGLPHGALDLDLMRRWNGGRMLPMIPAYLAIMAAMGALWWWLPAAALVAFLALSAWHFGQTDLHHWGVKSKAGSLIWGTSLLLGILLTHATETLSILTDMGVQLATVPALEALGFVLLTGSALVGLVRHAYALTLTALMLIVGAELPVLLTFGLYFIGQHSIAGWQALRQDLRTTHFELYRRALPFTLGAVATLGVFWWLRGLWTGNLIALFFVFLSCLSMAHMAVMHWFYRSKAPH